ncbi:MAG: FAD-binding protein, partial [Oscillospiraceae bacterium]
AMAARAGCSVQDMEFVQFYPISFLSPAYARGQVAGFPAYARLFNSKNDRFMRHYDARLELATRDMLCIAISKEVREGRGSLNGGVYCSLEHCAKDSLERELPGLFAIYRAAGIEPYTDRFEVGPSAHFFQGGVRVNRNRMTRISGLYAVGETAAGMHGANRLGQNALTDILVSGFIAGRHAAAMSNTVNAQVHESDIADTHLQNAGGSSLIQQRELRLQIRSIMQRGAGVLRDRVGLELAAKELSLCRSSLANCNRKADGVCARTAIENISMLLSAACVVKSALMREESRGCHYRDDYPQMDDSHWLKNTVAELDRDEIVMSTVQTETLKQNHTAEAQ